MSTAYPKPGFQKFIPWIIVIVLILGFDVIKVLPMTTEWIDLQKQGRTINQELLTADEDFETIKDKESEIQAQFDMEAKDFVLEESQIFPSKFDPYEVSKTLELFSLQHSLLNANSSLRIQRLAFGGGGGGTASMTLDLSCTEDTLRRVMKHFQSGELPEDFIDNPDLDARDVEYLRSHKLPLAHIESFRISDTGEGKNKNISLKVTFFYQS